VTLFLLNLLLALVWAMAVGRFTVPQLLLGYVLGFLVLATRSSHSGARHSTADASCVGLRFIAFFFVELLLSSLQIAYDSLTPRLRATPRIIAVPLDAATETEITLLANFLTLTPGTLSLDISADRRTLYVHAMYARDRQTFLTEVKRGLEARLLEVLR
jgi:multicomponent Na+:H+ antiporter subunit E